MSREIQIETIRRIIDISKQTLEDMRSKANLLNEAIPELKQRIKEDETRLRELEVKDE